MIVIDADGMSSTSPRPGPAHADDQGPQVIMRDTAATTGREEMLAPETILLSYYTQDGYTDRLDMWAAMHVLIEMLLGRPLYQHGVVSKSK